MQAKKTSLTLLYIVVYTVLLHAETLCKLVTCCPSSEWECRGLKNEEMVQGATKDRKGNPRNVQKRKSLAAGLAGNCGPEGDILQLIWKAYSNSKNILKKEKRRGRNVNELSDGKSCWIPLVHRRIIEWKGPATFKIRPYLPLFCLFLFSRIHPEAGAWPILSDYENKLKPADSSH